MVDSVGNPALPVIIAFVDVYKTNKISMIQKIFSSKIMLNFWFSGHNSRESGWTQHEHVKYQAKKDRIKPRFDRKMN